MLTQFRTQKDLAGKGISGMKHRIARTLTVCLTKDHTVDDIGATITSRIPGVLIAGKAAPVEGRVGIRDICDERLRNGEVGLFKVSVKIRIMG